MACLVALAGLAACERSPFSRLDPSGTTWAVTAIDQAEMRPGDPVVVDFDAAGKYTITGPCQIVTGDRWIDTDSDGFGFFGPVTQQLTCQDPGSDDEAIKALLAVERWEVLGDDAIRLTGPSIVDLSRIP